MQQAVDDGYLAIARELGVAVAPVGYAWWTLLVREPAALLWQPDGSHPTTEGTYLAACVLYATIFHERTTGLGFRSNVPPDEATRVQEAADSTIIGRSSAWNPG